MSDYASRKRRIALDEPGDHPKRLAISGNRSFEDGEQSTVRRRRVLRRSTGSMRDQSPRPRSIKYASISNTQHLCQSCATIDFNQVQPEPSLWKSTALKLGNLSQVTMNADCVLCQLFASMASLAYTTHTSDSPTLDDVTFYLCSFHTSAMYSHNWRNSRTLRGLETSISYAVVDEHVLRDKEESFTKERKMSNVMWPSRTSIQRSGFLAPVRVGEEEKRFAARILKTEADLSLVGGWVDFCIKNHQESCGLTDARPILALQVIDCNTGLVIPAKTDCEFLAMSYVWGAVPAKDLEKGESLLDRSTPVLIQDAISATKKLGYQYLWVDRYCILQIDGKERHSQIQQMDLVYSKAQATIIAVASPDPREGLHGVGRERSPSIRVNIGQSQYSYVPPHAIAEISSSPWASRGWTHQETILSRRRIFFCKNQIYFECAGMRCQDTMNAPLDLLHTKGLQMFSKWNRPGLFSRVRKTADPLNAVLDHISVYTRRHLTRPDDILNGIMGTFHAFETIYDFFRHYWGVPMVPDITYASLNTKSPRLSTRTEQFLTGLCWHLSGSRKRRAGFPSWSWAGWYGSVDPQRDENGYIENKYKVNVWIDSIFTSQMDLGMFCDTTAMDVFPKKPEPCVFIRADFFYVRFRLGPAGGKSKWEAVVNAQGGESVCAPFLITRHTSLGDEFHKRIMKYSWSAILVGERLRTKNYMYAGTKRKVLSGERPSMVIVVVDEVEKDVIERVGIIEIDDLEDKGRIEGITKHRRVRKYG